MINSGYTSLDDRMDEEWDNENWSELEVWLDSQAAMDTAEYRVSLQKLPTEQELLAMEADQDDFILDDRLLTGERRTAIRH